MTHSPGSKIAIAGDAVPSSLKQQLLLFDKVAVYQLESTIHWCDIISFFYDGSPSTVANDLRFLSEHGLVYDPGHPGEYLQQVLEKGDTWFHGKENPWFDGETEKITLEAVGARFRAEDIWPKVLSMSKRLGQSRSKIRRSPDVRRLLKSLTTNRNYEYQLVSRIISKMLQERDKLDATPLISENIIRPPEANDIDCFIPSNIVTMTLSKIPMPDDLTPWERILDFRNDPLTKGYLIGLRTWMADVARQNLSAIEAEQKLEWLMFQQAQHLRVHKITANSRSFGAVFVAAVEVLENLLKIKWGKAAQGIISIMDGQTELLKSEISGPAKEVNYLIKAKQTFG